MHKGYLCLVLHAHLPYIRHADRDDYLEERWVYEAMLECYLPLFTSFEKLISDGVDFRVTLSVSPTLLSMLDDSLIQKRFKKHLAASIELAVKEVKRTQNQPEAQRVARMYWERLRETAAVMSKHGYSLIPLLKKLHQSCCVEVITSCATHGFLPFMETEEAIRAQVRIAVDEFERMFGEKPLGIWLPECGYTPGVDRILAEAGIRYFFVDTHTIEHATPAPTRGTLAPVVTEYGIAAFARDQESSQQVWSSEVGYPGDHNYREFYRDIGYDLPQEYVAPYIHPSGIRVNTGFKYFRITGKTEHKEWYDPERAKEKAAIHAGHFMFNRERQVEYHAEHLDRKPLVVAPYDAELFGHWWYEGPQFIDYLCRKIGYNSSVLRMVTPSEYLDEYETQDRARLPLSSWGRNGYGEVWVNGKNDWLYRHLHRAERQMVELVEKMGDASTIPPLKRRALQQAARELLLSQSSDWAFIMDNQSVVEYAVNRSHDHLVHFHELHHLILTDQLDEKRVQQMERAFPIFPHLCPMYYSVNHVHKVNISQTAVGDMSRGLVSNTKVLMLSWEFPPHNVGGLSKAVYQLARQLVRQQVEVHVVTCDAYGAAEREVLEGVHVHRLKTYQPHQQADFFDWVFQLNLAMIDHVEKEIKRGVSFDLVHAHDWLVAFAALECKKQFGFPMVTTIHAMEHGRNQGLHTPLQHKIHQVERQIVQESAQTICCSNYMQQELKRHFALSDERIVVLPNGVDFTSNSEGEELPLLENRRRYALSDEQIVLFVGRMVREKGVHLLLMAAPEILKHHPQTKFLLAGRGPMLDEWKRMAWEFGVGEKAVFLGYIDDSTRDQLYHLADLAVFPSLYEPFGIVALEAISCGTPVLVADTGGLGEIVEHQETGLKMYPGDVHSLVTQVCWALKHQEKCREQAKKARKQALLRYDWASIASRTAEVYMEASKEHQSV